MNQRNQKTPTIPTQPMEQTGQTPPSPLRCPVCNQPLHQTNKQYLCPQSHNFDIAKQGYVNLLLPNQNAGQSGDDGEMIAARTRFLESGAYAFLSDEINREMLSLAEDIPQPFLFADAGCGEGYYTNRCSACLTHAGMISTGYGFDLSRAGIRYAARQAKTLMLPNVYGVASLFRMPLATGSVSALLNIFAPVAGEEFARILAPYGTLLMVVPAPQHLFGLKTVLYRTPYENEERRDTIAGFTLIDQKRVEKTIDVSAHKMDLFAMTPYFWKTSKEDQQKLMNAETVITQASFDLLVYRRDAEEI